MAVGYVVHQLAHRPAAFAIRRIELRIIESVYGSTEVLGENAQGLNTRGARVAPKGGRSAEASDGITKIVQDCHGTDFFREFIMAAGGAGPAVVQAWGRRPGYAEWW